MRAVIVLIPARKQGITDTLYGGENLKEGRSVLVRTGNASNSLTMINNKTDIYHWILAP